MKKILTIVILLWVSAISIAIEPPTNLKVIDMPNDDGKIASRQFRGIKLTWSSPIDVIDKFQIFRIENGSENQIAEIGINEVEILKNGDLRFIDPTALPGVPYAYKIVSIAGEETAESEKTKSIKAHGNLFHRQKIWILFSIILFTGVTLFFIQQGRSGREMFIRKISALDAVEEAVGRSTEMGRPIFFLTGLNGISDPATIAGINIFESVANYAVQDQTRLIAPCADPIVMNVMHNSLKEVYNAAGRPDLFSDDDVYFVNDRQFAYVAAVDGMIAREKPAAVFLQGYFYAESLILAEVGNSIGAIQIAGTSADTQLPFFIAACDYTLIGEELYAASAYIKNDPLQIGTLKAQDLIKLTIFVLMLIGGLLVLFDVNWILNLFAVNW